MREIIDGAAFRDMLLCASDALEKHKQPINELNVFPVPDGDTGTNMSLTMRSGADALRSKKLEGVTAVADCAASALLRGARGNSGVILSLLFRGISKAVKGMNELTAHSLADAMQEGVDAAYKAVMKPAEGTILTVSRVAAKAAMDFAEQGSDVELLLVCALEAAKDALELTVEQNPVLKRAGVVDAGGKGYVVILDAMLASLQGRMFSDYEEEKLPDPAALNEGADFGAFSSEDIEFAYDTVFIVRRTTDRPLEEYREYLVSIGDSLVIGEDDECFKVHVHTNEPGAAITEAQKYGTLEIAKIENMRSQSEDLAAGRKATSADALEEEEAPVKPEKRYGFVTVCAGEGMETLFRELGADGVVTGGQTMNPSTEDILRQVEKTPAETVFVLPNNKNIIMAAEQCVPISDRKVVVIPTRTVPQGISAMLAVDTYAGEEELAEMLMEAASQVHTALVTYAARDSEFDGHHIRAGEYLALLDGALLGSFTELPALMEAVAEGIAPFAPELISVYYGEDVAEADAEAAGELLAGKLGDPELSVINGGQPVYYFMIAAE